MAAQRGIPPEHVSADRQVHSDYYALDEYNRLNGVDHAVGAEGATSFEVTYGLNGEPAAVETPYRSLQYTYDAQDRLVSVSDQSKRLTYRYAEGEVDVRVQTDTHSPLNLLPAVHGGATFGADTEILWNRARPTPYRTLYIDSQLQAFNHVSDLGVILANKALEDSLSRLRLLDIGAAHMHVKSHFAKPSNVMFIPTEYWTINCYVPPPERCKGIIDPPSSSSFPADSVDQVDLEPGIQCSGGSLGGNKDFYPKFSQLINSEIQTILAALQNYTVWEKVKAKFPNGKYTIIFRADDEEPYLRVSGSDPTYILMNYNAWAAGRPGTRASALGHELVHVADFARGAITDDLTGYQSEVDAFDWELMNANHFELSACVRAHLRNSRDYFQECVDKKRTVRACDNLVGFPPPPQECR